MKLLLKLEELAQVAVMVALLAWLGAPWWCYALLAFGPDVGMLGYLAGPRVGAVSYNLLHHKGVALLVVAISLIGMSVPIGGLERATLLAGLVMYGHASLDRLFGYGLKHPDSFQHTHLGKIGKGV